MRIGLLADIHEDIAMLRVVLERLSPLNVDQLLLLGDIAFDGTRVLETVEMLRPWSPVGVWGNHDLGLVSGSTSELGDRFDPSVIDFFGTLCPQLVIGDAFFKHGLPSWDALDPVVYYLGGAPWVDGCLSHEFSQCSQSLIFGGHYHRWLLGTSEGILEWRGETSVEFADTERYFMVVDSVFHGAFGVLDTEQRIFTPYSVQADSLHGA